jgi:ribosome-binding protein aMBF1 (putative translation factor)
MSRRPAPDRDQRVMRARELAQEGLIYEEIAARMGTTKSAVCAIARVHHFPKRTRGRRIGSPGKVVRS